VQSSIEVGVAAEILDLTDGLHETVDFTVRVQLNRCVCGVAVPNHGGSNTVGVDGV